MRLSGEGFTRGLENLCTSKAGLLKKRRSRVLLAISAAAASVWELCDGDRSSADIAWTSTVTVESAP